MKTVSRLVLAVASVLAVSLGAQAAGDERQVPVGFSDAYIPSGFDSNSDTFVVASGIFPNGCYRWSEAEVSHSGTNVHEIRATANVSQGMCMMVLVPFTKEIHLGKLSVGNHAVRLINGDGTYIEKRLNIEE